jgi:hypothetical protein
MLSHEQKGTKNAAAEPTQPREPERRAEPEPAFNPVWHSLALNAGGSTPGDPGQPLDPSTRSFFEPRFGHDLGASGGGASPLASTLGRDIAFRAGQYRPDTQSGRRLLGHELAHVVQQGRGLATGPATAEPALEREAWRAGDAAADGARVAISGRAPAGVALHSTLSDSINNAWAARHDKGEVFNLLRASSPAPSDTDTVTAINAMFAGNSADLWLATTILQNGPETLWPSDLITWRWVLARLGGWAPEAGNIEAVLPDLFPDAGVASPAVRAYFFPGVTNERALVIGGVHGSELGGIEVVERLRTRLSAESLAGRPPYFTTILVPEVVPRAAAARRAHLRTTPFTQFDNTGRTVTDRPGHQADPNRNYPQPGTDLAAAHNLGQTRPDHAELLFTPPGGTTARPPQDTRRFATASQRMLPETRILLALIERFHPRRIASVHGHWLGAARGDAAGVFVDPRGGFDPATDTAATTQGTEDDALTRQSLVGSTYGSLAGSSRARDPFAGNVSTRWPRGVSGAGPYTPAAGSQTVHYTSTAHGEGTSLGGYAPAAGITTVTVEVPQYDPGRDAAQLDAALNLHRDLLEQVFLGRPSTGEPQ